MADTKLCSNCGVVKPLDEFHRRKSSRDGHVSHCKVCVKAYQQGYYRENSAAVRRKVNEKRNNDRRELIWYRKNYPQDGAPWLA